MARRRAKGDGAVYFDQIAGGWYGAVDLGRDAAGRRRRMKTRGCANKTTALRQLQELRRRAGAGEVLTADRVTVRHAVEDFLARGLAPDLASNTRYGLDLLSRALVTGLRHLLPECS
ncbi:MAG: hypothetical protein ACYDAQ_02295 [Mycobacteriales bacterium]